jgi:hypothetical protein
VMTTPTSGANGALFSQLIASVSTQTEKRNIQSLCCWISENVNLPQRNFQI